MFGIGSFVLFTYDKLIHSIAKQVIFFFFQKKEKKQGKKEINKI